MNTKIRKSAASVVAAIGLALGLLGASAVVPEVANAAAAGTYDYSTQWVCFTVPYTTHNGHTAHYAYVNKPARIQAWVPGYGLYTFWEGRTNNQGCIYATYLRGYWWRVTATDQFTADHSRNFYGVVTDWFWIDGSRSSYPTATLKMSRGVGWG